MLSKVHIFKTTVAAAASILAFAHSVTAQQTVGVWSTDAGHDIDFFETFNMNGDKISIQCGNGGVSAGNATIFIEIGKKRAPPNSQIDVLIDGKVTSILYTDDSGAASTNSQVMHGWFREFWKLTRRGSTMKVTFSNGLTAEFSLRGTSQILTTEPCGEAETRMTETGPALVTPIDKNNLETQIRDFCQKSWPTDFVMQKYCVEEQSKAASELGYK
jgi:hypothetical protein